MSLIITKNIVHEPRSRVRTGIYNPGVLYFDNSNFSDLLKDFFLNNWTHFLQQPLTHMFENMINTFVKVMLSPGIFKFSLHCLRRSLLQRL